MSASASESAAADSPAHSAPSLLENLGLLAGVVALPFITFYLVVSLVFYDGALVVPDLAFLAHIPPPTLRSTAIYVGWFLFQLALARFLPGRIVQGVPLDDGRTLPYVMNGWRAFVVTLVVAAGLVVSGLVPATLLAEEWLPLLTTANLFTFGICVFMHVIGRQQASPAERQRGVLQAFFHGATLNPRSGDFDWKFFCESRPGMILWVLVNFSAAAVQYKTYGEVSGAMALVCLFQAFYVADYCWLEEAILTTWDIRHETYGFMLCWGCLVWIPFTFSLQAIYLATHPFSLPLWALVGLVLLNFAGYYIFRTSNLQKHRFRSDPARPIWGRAPDFIATARGTKLLVGGWWGIARHANYLGDLMMGLAWCLCTGLHRVIPYFYFIYFVILLVHRERRDQAHCAKKYGADWVEYERRVRWRIVPGLY